jgi:PAS domain S-box-containing protein
MHKTRLEWKQVLRCWDAAFRVAALYAFFGMFWILFSDRIVENVVQDRMQMVLVQTYKGWFFVLVTGVMIALTVYRYTSKLLAAEQSILQTRSRFRSRLNSAHSLLKTVIDSAPDLVFVKSRSGVYMHCNASFIAFVGRTEEEILGKTDFELFPGKTASFFRKKDELVFSSRSEQRNEEWLTYPDGTRLLHDTLKAPYFSKSGELLGLIGVSRDITEQRKVAVELQRAKEAAEASSEAKSLFLANMSHEIRTPLNGVIGALQLLEEGGVSGEQRDLLDMANNAALSLKHLIQDLLDLSQIEAGKMHIVKEPLDLENLLHSCVAMFAEQAREAGSSLLVNVDPNLPERLEGDRGRLLPAGTNRGLGPCSEAQSERLFCAGSAGGRRYWNRDSGRKTVRHFRELCTGRQLPFPQIPGARSWSGHRQGAVCCHGRRGCPGKRRRRRDRRICFPADDHRR